MKFLIRGTNIRLSEALRKHTEAKIINPLQKFSQGINKIIIRFKDVDLSRTNSPVHAKALVVLANGHTIEIQQTDNTYYDAVNLLSHRIRRHVSKQVAKQRDRRRRIRLI